MRVALFGTISGMGGIERHTRILAKSLLDAGVKVMVVSSVMNVISAGVKRDDENESLLRGGAEILWIPEQPSLSQRLLDVPRIAREVRRFAPDVLLGTQTSYHLGLLAMLLPRKVRKIFFEVMSGESNGCKDPRWLVKWFFDEVVGQSPRVGQTFARSFGWKKEVCAIPAFPEPLELTARLPEARRKIVPSGTARAGFFSRLVEGKQAFWLVQQWDTLKTLISELHIHGGGPEQPAIEAYIAKHGLSERVRCCGRYPSGQPYADLIATYDLTLLPTIFPEGAPLVLLESMACGVPFVANGVGGIPDYVTGNPDCIVVATQPDFLDGIRAMTKAMDEGKIDQLRLQKFYLAHYSHASIEKKWLEYLGVVKR